MVDIMKARADAEAVFRAAVARVDPEPMIERSLRITGVGSNQVLTASNGREEFQYNLSNFDRIFATGMGKASARMARGLEKALGERLSDGIVAVKEGHVETLARVRILEAGHPVPDARSETAARTILNLGESLGTRLTERDLVIVLVSGGGSAILCAPAEGLTLEDKTTTTRLLLSSGVPIGEVNCVRKHLSAVKGGRLATAYEPATVLTLLLSDVIGDDLDAIASGPTVPDTSTFAEALEIVRRYGIEEKLPPAVRERLRFGAAGGPGAPAETPKPGDPSLSRANSLLVGTNVLALAAAEAEAKKRGYETIVLSSRITGEARELALVYLGIGKDILCSGFPLRSPACLIAGGESTVTLRGKGKGGRNQEMALAFLANLGRSPKDGEGLVFLSAGTDGNDGPTDAAGAIADLDLLSAARAMDLDPEAALAENDSYRFFSRSGGLIVTGPTNTNVCDIQVLIAV